MENQRAKALLDKYNKGECSPEERAVVESWFNTLECREPAELSDEDYERVRLQLWENIQGARQGARTRRLWPRIAAAASILLCCGAGLYYYQHNRQEAQAGNKVTMNDIAPGSNKAILITRGREISVTDAKNGLLAQQNNTSITKTASGKIVYTNAESANEDLVYDTLITPRGGQHELALADGSTILLNADTRIRFPERFAKNERRIELISGEAIFHVKHNAKLPFYITVKGQSVKDLGTVFDINAYDDEPAVKTTLVEGSVEISRGTQSKVLKPGQQGIVHQDEPFVVQSANIDQVLAWQNNKFYFEKTGLRELMRQVSRWYNIDVVYEGNVSDEGYTGQPSRKVSLSQMLKILEYGDIHYKIEPGKGKNAGTLTIRQ